MATNPKILKRIQNLARLADEGSGAELPERESAALEVVKLLRDHNVHIDGEPVRSEDVKRKRKQKTERQQDDSPAWQADQDSTWMPSVTRGPTTCSICHQGIMSGQDVYQMTGNPGFIVHDWHRGSRRH